MSTLFSIAAGWTDTIGPFTLRVDGVAFDLTGYTVELQLRDSARNLVVLGGSVVVRNQTLYPGQVDFTPTAEDFTFDTGTFSFRQPFKIRWKVTDGAGRIVFFPNGEPDEISVYE